MEYVVADAFNLENTFKPNVFDIVFSQGFFEHFSNPEIRALLKQQLKIGKKVIFSSPSKYYPTRDFGNERLLSVEDWKEILTTFNIEYIKYYGFVLPDRKEILKFFIKPVYLYKILFSLVFKESSHILVKLKKTLV